VSSLPDGSPGAGSRGATRRWLHPKGGENGKDIARPAEFLVDAAGTIRWVNLTDDIRVRARPETVLEAINRLGSH
jgi:peroxiredoxin